MPAVKVSGEIEKIHEEACERGALSYPDPETGSLVFTRHSHLQRGFCCGSGCRHCPYEHVNVPPR